MRIVNGGYLALEVTRQAPDRVTRLAILGSNARPDTEAQSQGRRDLMALTRRGEFHGVSDRLLPKLVHERRFTDQGLSDLIKSMALNIGKDGFIRQETALIDRVDARPWLPDIRCSTLVLCGRQDALRGPDYHEEMAALIPDATLVVIPDCGHLSTLEQPSMVNAQLRVWLTP